MSKSNPPLSPQAANAQSFCKLTVMAHGLKRPKALRSEDLPLRLCIGSEVIFNIHIVIWVMTLCSREGGFQVFGSK